MTSILSYQKIISAGPNGTTVSLRPPLDDDGESLATELATLDGTTYVAVPDDASLPDQPDGIAPQAVTLDAALRQRLRAAAPLARLIRTREQARIDAAPLAAEQAALWGAQQLAGLGLASAADVTAAARNRLAARRYLAETAGTTWDGHPVATDRQSQALITGALLASTQTGFDGIDWKMADGSFVSLDAADVAAMAAAVKAHVQAAFANEAALVSAVESDPDADIDSGWPA